ncbi:MAG: 50S ribosomal protein L39e [Candidatus Woesearchaeota archaeon]
MIIMATFKHLSRKLRLIKLSKQTRWAPFWTVPKAYGTGRKVHPGRHTTVKRNWRRTKTKA